MSNHYDPDIKAQKDFDEYVSEDDNLGRAIKWTGWPGWSEKYTDATLLAAVAGAALQEVQELRDTLDPMGTRQWDTPLDAKLAELFPEAE